MSLGRRRCFLGLVITTSCFIAACGDDPPSKEVQQAQQAIEAARTAGADRYAKDEFTASQAALTRAQSAVVARDYRQALNDALDARDRAQTAAKDASDKKAQTKVDADRALHDIALAIVDARAKLRGAEGARRAPRLVAALRRDIAEAEMRVQEARTAFDRGDYLDALELLTAPTAHLHDSARLLDAVAPPVVRRRP
jgi:hypothetical protein